ncbi:hypothetical protein BH09BAC1_BH09BAC1_03080 [soil metagenome]
MEKLYALLLFCSCIAFTGSGQSFAPEVWASAGGYYTSATGSVAWTLGETVIETAFKASSTITVTQGFHQPSFLTTGISQQPTKDISPIFSVFPNPTSGFIRIKLSKPVDKAVQVSLFTALGQLIQSNLWQPNAANAEMEISLENLANGVYFLQLTVNGESLGVYKVQKDRN